MSPLLYLVLADFDGNWREVESNISSLLNKHINNVTASLFTGITNSKIKMKSYFINGTKYILFQSSQNAIISFSSFVFMWQNGWIYVSKHVEYFNRKFGKVGRHFYFIICNLVKLTGTYIWDIKCTFHSSLETLLKAPR